MGKPLWIAATGAALRGSGKRLVEEREVGR
jgi:hypothetical protein